MLPLKWDSFMFCSRSFSPPKTAMNDKVTVVSKISKLKNFLLAFTTEKK